MAPWCHLGLGWTLAFTAVGLLIFARRDARPSANIKQEISRKYDSAYEFTVFMPPHRDLSKSVGIAVFGGVAGHDENIDNGHGGCQGCDHLPVARHLRIGDLHAGCRHSGTDGGHDAGMGIGR
jgi:hypothetical protein